MSAATEGTRRKRTSFKRLPKMSVGELHKALRHPSKRGFTALPSDHVDAPLYDPDAGPEQELLALLYGATFHRGHRRPYACHKDGSAITIEWCQQHMRPRRQAGHQEEPVSLEWVQRVAKRLERKGYLSAECHAVYLHGQIDLNALKKIKLAEGEGGEERANDNGVRTPTKPLPPRVAAAIQDWDEERKAGVLRLWAEHREEFDAKRAAVDARLREEDAKVFETRVRERGVEVKLAVEPRVKERPWTVEIRFVDLAEAGGASSTLVREGATTGEAVPGIGSTHSESEGVRELANRSAHPSSSLLGSSESFSEGAISSSSVSCAAPPPESRPETTHALGLRPRQPSILDPKAKGPLNKGEFLALVAALCQDARISPPDRAMVNRIHQQLESSEERRGWLNQAFGKVRSRSVEWRGPGVLESDARAWHEVGWPAERKRHAAAAALAAGAAAAAAAEAELAELKDRYFNYLDDFEERATAEALPADRAAARRAALGAVASPEFWQHGMTEAQRSAAALVHLRHAMRARALPFDEWREQRAKKGAGV